MEELFQYDIEDYMQLFEDTSVPVLNQSAFVNYEPTMTMREGSVNRNIHKRMMEMLMRRQIPAMCAEPRASERSQRHMISERMRRERLKQCFSTLHSLLPPGTKSDKNSIIQAAVRKIEELKRMKINLERKNKEVQEGVLGEVVKIELKLSEVSSSSGIDSVLEVLKCMKETGSEIKAIQSTISTQELSATLQVHPKNEDYDFFMWEDLAL